jgi:hypothetical protein
MKDLLPSSYPSAVVESLVHHAMDGETVIRRRMILLILTFLYHTKRMVRHLLINGAFLCVRIIIPDNRGRFVNGSSGSKFG